MNEVDDFRWFYCKFNMCMNRVHGFLMTVGCKFDASDLDKPKNIMKCCEDVFMYYAKSDCDQETTELLYEKIAEQLNCTVECAKEIIDYDYIDSDSDSDE